MKERFGAPQEAPRNTVEHLGLSPALLEAYTKELMVTEKGKQKRSITLSVEEWRTPHGKIPPTAEMYLVSKKTADGYALEFRAMHPEALDEEDLSTLLGDAMPRAVGVERTPKTQAALEKVLLERRRATVLREIGAISDKGIRTVCEHVVTQSVDEKLFELPVHDHGSDMLYAIHRALTDGSHVALPEMKRAIHRFGLEWMGWPKTEQDRIRKHLAHSTAHL